MTVEEMRAWYALKYRAAEEASAKCAERVYEARIAELDLLEAEGRGHTPAAEWVRAWLAGDWPGCDRALAAMYPRAALPETVPDSEDRAEAAHDAREEERAEKRRERGEAP